VVSTYSFALFEIAKQLRSFVHFSGCCCFTTQEKHFRSNSVSRSAIRVPKRSNQILSAFLSFASSGTSVGCLSPLCRRLHASAEVPDHRPSPCTRNLKERAGLPAGAPDRRNPFDQESDVSGPRARTEVERIVVVLYWIISWFPLVLLLFSKPSFLFVSFSKNTLAS
jgi:hypothetical protein